MSGSDGAVHGGGAHRAGPYVVIWAVLLVLLFVSMALGHVPNPYLMTALVFSVAIAKAVIVALRFMHLRLEPWSIVALLVIAVLFMVALVAGVSPDVTFNPTIGPTNL